MKASSSTITYPTLELDRLGKLKASLSSPPRGFVEAFVKSYGAGGGTLLASDIGHVTKALFAFQQLAYDRLCGWNEANTIIRESLAAWQPKLGDPVQMSAGGYPAADWRHDWVGVPMFYAGTVATMTGPEVWIAHRWPMKGLGDLTDGFSMDDLMAAPAPEKAA